MARITTKAWNNYISTLRRLSDRATKEMLSMMTKLSNQYNEGIITLAEYENAAIDFAYALATKYGEGAGAMACEMYDAIAEPKVRTWLRQYQRRLQRWPRQRRLLKAR